MHLVVPPGGSFRETRRIDLDSRVLTVGRAEGCDVRIDVPGVDDEHAKISELALVAVGPDCAIGDVPLDAGQRRLLSPGNEIQIGSVVLAVDGADPEVARGAPPRAGPRIRVVEGQNVGTELVLAHENREYVIGRSAKGDLVLEDREVSREHLKMVRRGLSVFIFDASSTRGSWLGRAAVYQGTRLEWDPSRQLKVGATILSLDLPEAARRSIPTAQPSAPMTAPPRSRPAAAPPSQRPNIPLDPGPPPTGIIAYHYDAKPPASMPPASIPGSMPPSMPPGSIPGALPASGAPGPPSTGPRMAAPSSMPPGMPPPGSMAGSTAPASIPASAPGSRPPSGPMQPAGAMPLGPVVPGPPIMPSVPPPRSSIPTGPRTAWKKTGPTIGRASGLLLLAVAGIAILGAIFVVFSLME